MTPNQSAPCAVLVDAYSTGNFLPAAFARLGVDVVHVQSTPEPMTSMLQPNLAEYRANVVHTGDFADTVERLRAYRPVAVLAGQEPGVPLADALSERLGLASNGSRQSLARRDKYRMIETLRAAGIRCARQYRSADPGDLVAWTEADGRYPVVVKPLSSASTDGVFICRNAAEVAAAAERVLTSRDIFDLPNNEALVQSYLAGTEYIVDTVSADGARFVCGVWEYEKSSIAGGKRVYDKDILAHQDAAPVADLVSYVDEVLAALGIRHGAVHAEVIMTEDGPALVEIGARLNGNMNPGFHDVCLGTNQADLMALAYTRPAEFARRYGGRVYTKLREAMVHNTRTEQDGVVTDVDQTVVDKIAALPSVYLMGVKLAPGKRIRPTIDLLTSPLRIFLTHEDPAQLLADHRVIQDLKDEVYQVART